MLDADARLRRRRRRPPGPVQAADQGGHLRRSTGGRGPAGRRRCRGRTGVGRAEAAPGRRAVAARRLERGGAGSDLLGPDPESAVPADAQWCGPGAWEACRVEAGVPVMGRELDERTIAAEAGLVERTVSFTKGCYTGQELVARLDARGTGWPATCGLVVLAPDGPGGRSLDPVSDLVGADLLRQDGDRVVGSCTSAACSAGRAGPACSGTCTVRWRCPALSWCARRMAGHGPRSPPRPPGCRWWAASRPSRAAGRPAATPPCGCPPRG